VEWVFGELRLDTDRRELWCRGDLVALEPQTFDVLAYLVTHRDRVVPKEELMDQIWGGRFVSEAAVTSRIKQARRAVGDDGQSQTSIRTSHGRGYRFVAEVGTSSGSKAPPGHPAHAPEDEVSSPVLFAKSGERRIAYHLTGQGPPDIVLVGTSSYPPVLTAEDLAYQSFVAGLGRLGRVVRLVSSDGDGLAPDLGAAALDVLSVMDGAASERAVVFGETDAGPLAAFFAATHAERVAGLLLYGTDREAATPAALASINVATMVLHRPGDTEVPSSAARALAAAIPEAEYVELEGTEHAVTSAAQQIIAAVADFVEDAATAQAPGRSLSALVGLAGDHVTSLAEVLVQLGGVERRGPENALLVSFDGPATAMRALASRRARGLLRGVGVGVAIDEVSSTSPFVAGHGVDVARLVALQAPPGEVLMPNVIKDLLAGSGLVVEPAGTLALDHVGPHPVYRWIRQS